MLFEKAVKELLPILQKEVGNYLTESWLEDNLKVIKLPEFPDPHFIPSPGKLITFLGKNGSIDKQIHINRATRRRLKLYNNKLVPMRRK